MASSSLLLNSSSPVTSFLSGGNPIISSSHLLNSTSLLSGGVNSSSSSSPVPAYIDPWQSETSRVLQMVATVIIIVVGVPLNLLVVWVLGVKRVIRRPNLSVADETRTASSFRVYVVNLALADLVLLLRTPLMFGYLAHHFSWPLGMHACRLVMFLRGLGLYAAACLLCAVAVERCLCLLRPVWASLKRPRWAVPLACGVLWLLAFCLAAPYLRTAVLKEMGGKMQCLESDPKDGTPTGYFVTETIFGFLLPVTIFLSCNILVLITARRAEGGGMMSPTATGSLATSAGSTVTSPVLLSQVSTMPGGAAQSLTNRRLGRLYRVLLLTMLLFLVCWVPYFCFRLMRWVTGTRPHLRHLNLTAIRGYYVSLFLVYVKSMLNPIMYVFAARGLGRTMRASLLSAVERVFNDENSESMRRKSLRRKDSQF
ncbi:C3a anaphylatoxin chemotactic receptor [Engraulis encrasicolus]|uniref:C3a anaphylatoxin chemotactic receptor n=1 Tax=Engraulis encrasicolus TaxID=184585 RepID=UPI002FD6B701